MVAPSFGNTCCNSNSKLCVIFIMKALILSWRNSTASLFKIFWLLLVYHSVKVRLWQCFQCLVYWFCLCICINRPSGTEDIVRVYAEASTQVSFCHMSILLTRLLLCSTVLNILLCLCCLHSWKDHILIYCLFRQKLQYRQRLDNTKVSVYDGTRKYYQR